VRRVVAKKYNFVYQRHKGVKYIQKLDDSITKGYSFIPISNFID